MPREGTSPILFARSLETRDAEALERAWRDACRAGTTADLRAQLIEALRAPWHRLHEDIALEIQRQRLPEAVDALFETATVSHGYLDYDEHRGLARKCVWALADIGTEDARARLEQLSRCSDELVADYARKRLARWEDEAGRKRR